MSEKLFDGSLTAWSEEIKRIGKETEQATPICADLAIRVYQLPGWNREGIVIANKYAAVGYFGSKMVCVRGEAYAQLLRDTYQDAIHALHLPIDGAVT